MMLATSQCKWCDVTSEMQVQLASWFEICKLTEWSAIVFHLEQSCGKAVERACEEPGLALPAVLPFPHCLFGLPPPSPAEARVPLPTDPLLPPARRASGAPGGLCTHPPLDPAARKGMWPGKGVGAGRLSCLCYVHCCCWGAGQPSLVYTSHRWQEGLGSWLGTRAHRTGVALPLPPDGVLPALLLLSGENTALTQARLYKPVSQH